jgi:hypothetical protein
MGIQAQRVEPHWNYLLSVERELEQLSHYVEFDQRNFACFGIEIARILLACGAETDVVCKQLCQYFDPKFQGDNINSYRDLLVKKIPQLPTFEVQLPRFGLHLHPWDEWKRRRGVPFWWTAYNKTKHERHTQYHQANLKNALNAVAGLFVVAVYLYQDKARVGELLPQPSLLRVGEANYGGLVQGTYELRVIYSL